MAEQGIGTVAEGSNLDDMGDYRPGMRAIEELGIPVLVERSSYESEPLGRLEWIKLYGLLFGKSEEAQTFFDEAVAKLEDVDADAV